MSGLKESDIVLQRQTAQLLKAQQDRKKAGEQCRICINEAQKLMDRLGNLSAENEEISTKFIEYTSVLSQQSKGLKVAETRVESIELPQYPGDVVFEDLAGDQQILNEVKAKIKNVKALVRNVNKEIIQLKEADENIGAVEFEMEQFQSDLNAGRDILTKWMPHECASLDQGFNRLKDEFNELRSKKAESIEATELAAELRNRIEEIRQLHARLKNNLNESEKREEMHDKRLYILKSLREVCASLGFEEIADPRYERNKDFNSPIVHEIDTLDEGKISFRIHLENKIDSRSALDTSICGTEFAQLSELLSKEFGINTHFKLEDGSDLPKLKTKTGKPLPESATKKRTN